MIKQRLLRELPWIDLTPSARILSLLIESLRSHEFPFYCIQGPHGSGKTRMMLEVAKALAIDEQIWVAGVDAKNANVPEAILKALGETNINPHITLKERLTLTLKQKFSLGQKVILLIDSAELLDQDLLRLLFDLGKSGFCHQAEEQYSFSLMLFMGMAPSNIYTKKLLSEAKSFTLPPMSAIQIKRLIEHVYEFIGKEHGFSSSDISRLHGMSYGYPGRLFNLLNLKPDTLFLRNKYYAIGAGLLVIIGLFFIIKPFLSPKTLNDLVVENPIVINPTTPESEIISVEAPLIEIDKGSDIPLDQGNVITQTDDELALEPSELHTVIDPRQSLDEEQVANIDHELVNDDKPITDADNSAATVEIMTNPAEYFIIRLTEGTTQQGALAALEGRSIPGSPKSALIIDNGVKKWITYIGPYTTKAQAITGMKHLPNSLQRLNLKVLSSEAIQ